MKTYIVAIDVRATYRLHIEADSEEQAREAAEAMQSTDVRERGSFQDVETEVVAVSEKGGSENE